MKITKRMLKRLIREELSQTLNEALTPAELAAWNRGYPTSTGGGTQRMDDDEAGVPVTGRQRTGVYGPEGERKAPRGKPAGWGATGTRMGKVSFAVMGLIKSVNGIEQAISDSQGWEEKSCYAGSRTDEEKRSMIQERDNARMQLRKLAARVVNGFDDLQSVIADRGDELGESL